MAPPDEARGRSADADRLPIGLIVGSSLAPEKLRGAARSAEAAGFDELWVAEDFFLTGGISAAAIALEATERIRVGLGVVSAVVRHPALLAMEIATLARAHPGRLIPGIGLGVPAWMRQMDRMPDSPLTAVRECLEIVRTLLDGEQADQEGRTATIREARLAHPPAEHVPLVLGVIGPKMLRLSGASADGTVLSVLAGEEYIRAARAAIDAGRQEAGRTDEHRVTVFAIYAVSRDRDAARAAAREALAFYAGAGGTNLLTDAAGISEELTALTAAGADLREAVPESWVDRLTVSGTPDDVRERLAELHRAGADAVALLPVPATAVDDLVRLTAGEVLAPR